MNFKKLLKLIFNKIFVQKLIAYVWLIVFAFLFHNFLFIFFLTFIFSYLFLTFWNFLKEKIDDFIPKVIRNKRSQEVFKKLIGLNIIIVFLYLAFIGILFYAMIDLIPQITKDLRDFAKYIPAFSDQIALITSKLEEIRNLNTQIWGTINDIITKQDLDLILEVFERLKTAGVVFVKILISLILSYIFIVDRDKLSEYLTGIKNSNFRFFYDEYKIIFEKITRTFGLVFKAQSVIALTNAILTTLGLLIIWSIHWASFPFIYTLAIIVFLCGFIPVLGTFISSFPILVIGFSTYGWWTIVVEIIFLITFIHAVEAYYLNPKIVSSFVRIPVSLTFLILIISEHLMGFAGLIIWISSFYLLMELFRDADRLITRSRQTLQDMNEVSDSTKDQLKKSVRVSRKID